MSISRALPAGLALLLLLSCTAPAPLPLPPNIVYVQSDTHRWGAMSFTQTPQVVTPNMERLAEQGVSLDRYYINLPICTPYRAIMMSGRWPYQQGLMANHMSLAGRTDMPEDQKTRGTIAWTFKDAGYATAHFGKWHLGGNDARPFGFDRSVIFNSTNNHRRNPVIIDGGEPEIWTGESNATETTSRALDWIAQQSQAQKPFFAVISLNPPHGPFNDAPESKIALYAGEEALPFHPLDQIRDWEQHRDYHALISGIDSDLGMLMARLDQLGLADNTILVYTSDHGAMTGIDGVSYGQKRHPNDESSRVPFLVRWPGHIPAGVRTEELASTIDVFPTIAGLAGVSDAYVQTLPGKDLSPLLRGEPGASGADRVYLAHPSNMNNNGSRHEIVWRAVVDKNFTYAVTTEGEHRLWKNQPGYQSENLIADPAYVETRRRMWRELDQLLDQAERPYYDQWFANAPDDEVAAWNAEHGFGKDNTDRQIGRQSVFDLSVSKPPSD